ncbi:MAG: RNA-binding domain-containing protein [Candidatus Heimdallarchaeaceae archaeon]
MDIIVSKLTFSFSVHVTEVMEKNMTALSNLTKGINQDHAITTESLLEGGYGNPIKFIEVSFTKTTTIDKIIKYLASRLSDKDKEYLGSEFENRFDSKRNTFFLRFDKNAIYGDKLLITDSSNIIKLAIKLRAFTKQANYKSFLIERGIIT